DPALRFAAPPPTLLWAPRRRPPASLRLPLLRIRGPKRLLCLPQLGSCGTVIWRGWVGSAPLRKRGSCSGGSLGRFAFGMGEQGAEPGWLRFAHEPRGE